jgi:ribosomal protein L37E
MRSRSCSAPTAATNSPSTSRQRPRSLPNRSPSEKPLEAQPVKSATPAPAPAVVSSAANESTPATYTDCDEFKPHAFKKDKCSNCGYAKDKHRPEATPEGKALVKAPVEPPKPAAREPVPAATTVPPKAPAKEQQPAATASAPPKPTPPAAEGPSSDTDCTDFKPHPFRKQMCANCGHTQASHTAPKAPVAAVLKPTAPAPGGTEQAGVPAPAAPPAPMETDDAACPRFEPHAFKKLQCKTCGAHRDQHTSSSAPAAPTVTPKHTDPVAPEAPKAKVALPQSKAEVPPPRPAAAAPAARAPSPASSAGSASDDDNDVSSDEEVAAARKRAEEARAKAAAATKKLEESKRQLADAKKAKPAVVEEIPAPIAETEAAEPEPEPIVEVKKPAKKDGTAATARGGGRRGDRRGCPAPEANAYRPQAVSRRGR